PPGVSTYSLSISSPSRPEGNLLTAGRLAHSLALPLTPQRPQRQRPTPRANQLVNHEKCPPVPRIFAQADPLTDEEAGQAPPPLRVDKKSSLALWRSDLPPARRTSRAGRAASRSRHALGRRRPVGLKSHRDARFGDLCAGGL